MRITLIVSSFLMLSAPSHTHDYLTFDELAEAFNWDFDNADVIAAKPTAEFHDKYGDPNRLINRAYVSLSR